MKVKQALVGLLCMALALPAFAEQFYLSTATRNNGISAESNVVSTSAYTTRVLLYKVIVASPTTGATLRINDGRVPGGSTVAIVDASSRRDIEYNVFLSSGLRWSTDTADTRVTLLYRFEPPMGGVREFAGEGNSYNYWCSSNEVITSTITQRPLMIYKVIVSSPSWIAGSSVTIWDARIPGGDSNDNLVYQVDGSSFSDVKLNVYLSSGMLVSVTNGIKATILYRPLP